MRERKGDEVFSDDFAPNVLHRNEHLELLGKCFEPIESDKTPENVFLIGPSGTGKTVSVKKFLNNVEHGVYLNCWNHRSTHELLRKLLLNLGEVVHGRESTAELAEKLEGILKQKKIVVCLDEVDKLKEHDILYTLSRNGCGLVLISNRYDALAHLNSRIDSSLGLTQIEFPAYTFEELIGILKQRCEVGELKHFKDEHLKTIAYSAKGDARVGIDLLRRTVKHARGKKVQMEHVKRAVSERMRLSKTTPLSQLSEDQLAVYTILAKWGKMLSGELYKEYCRSVENPVVDRAYRKWMRRMVKVGLVRESGIRRWRRYEVVA